MNRTVVPPARAFALGVVAALSVAACSGSDGDDAIDASDGSRQAPEVEDAIVDTTTTSSTTSTTTTTSTTSTTTTTEPPALVSDELCTAVGAFYTTAQTTDFIDPNDAFAIEVTVSAAGLAVDDVLVVADGDPIAAPWVEVRRLLDIVDGLAAIDWDIDRSGELGNSDEIADALFSLEEEIDATAPFLIAECGLTQSDIDELDAASRELFDDVVTPPAADPIELTDDTGRITMTVPGTWTDTVTAPQGDVSRLGAAPDFAAFDSSFANEGGFVLAVDVADPDAWQSILADTRERLEGQGCSVTAELPYDDGVYTGTELSMDCGVPGMTADVIAARDAEGSIAVAAQVIRPVGDTTGRDLIVESFLIS